MPIEIEATYRVVTPLFCGGAEPKKSAELRLASFKGVLRFWWRALEWSRCGGDLEGIRKREDALFGSAGGGQSCVSMRLNPDCAPRKIHADQVLTVSQRGGSTVGEGARYLGYGVMKTFGSQRGQLTRACLRSPFEFTVQLRLRDHRWNEEESKYALASLRDVLICLGTHGGMGAKSRKGYGSLVIRSLTVDGEPGWRLPQSMNDLREALADLRRRHHAAGQPEYTAVSEQARQVLVSSDKREPLELLDLLGREFMRYRSWGRGGRVLGQDSEKKFKGDHDLMKTDWRRRDRHPRRIAFGLPHNYGKPEHLQIGPCDPGLDRRASPLFIHIHECGDRPVAVLSFLPARFLPEGKSDISVGGKRVRQAPEADLYRPIHQFLDRLLDPDKRKEPFAEVVEVRP